MEGPVWISAIGSLAVCCFTVSGLPSCVPVLRSALACLLHCRPAAGHVAGAAIDLKMCTEDGVEIDMGGPEAATPEESDGACYTLASGLPAQAQHNRTMMIEALTTVGMVNYPTEWWHWSYGDRYWAPMTKAPVALYGPQELG
jgi:hypothetical protein